MVPAEALAAAAAAAERDFVVAVGDSGDQAAIIGTGCRLIPLSACFCCSAAVAAAAVALLGSRTHHRFSGSSLSLAVVSLATALSVALAVAHLRSKRNCCSLGEGTEAPRGKSRASPWEWSGLS